MSDDVITVKEYRTEVLAIAKGLVEEAGGDQDVAYEALHAAIDGHSWIIYTYRNMQVLQHSNNCDAYFDEYGSLEAAGYAEALAKMAFSAMYADVQEAIIAEYKASNI